MTPETASVDVDGHPVRYRATGTGPPVVLLHGLGRSLEDWEPLRTALPAHRLLALDLPGFGWSPAPPEPGLGTMAEHVAGCLDRLGITAPVHLVGNSLGGAVAMRLAVRHPARVASLALAAGAGFGREVTWALRVLDLPLLWRFLPRPDRRGVRTAERSLYADRARAAPFDQHEGGEAHRAQRECGHHMRLGEGAGAALDDAVHQGGDGQGGGELARPVQTARAGGPRVGEQWYGRRQGEDGHGYGGQEYPAPGDVVEDCPGHQGADGQRRHQRGGPDADHPAALVRVRYGVADQSQGARQQRRRTGTGQGLSHQQRRRRIREQGDRRARGREHQARLEDLLAAVDIPDDTGGQDQRRHRQDERRRDPGELRGRRLERPLNGRQADGDGGHRQVGDEYADAGHDQRCRPSLSRSGHRRGRVGGRGRGRLDSAHVVLPR
ncbi:hydrolase [Streptomyces clavuligerus]|uniref:Putative hydrolase n=1 Tax=Streptomyces clavuligerus TaxID=1901 RepID=E2Q095_STRCL|nr:Putative hydrolase [Streptomyces clavuligerus]QCS04432.1 hydrolase [Streptomyces clavuligerus]QPJ96185.1 alpha/beta fold hydrolase [Streptomyces clavuligerus]